MEKQTIRGSSTRSFRSAKSRKLQDSSRLLEEGVLDSLGRPRARELPPGRARNSDRGRGADAGELRRVSTPSRRSSRRRSQRRGVVRDAMDFLVHHMLRSSAGRTPEKEAMVCGDERLSYRETWDRICALAAGLRALGMERGRSNRRLHGAVGGAGALHSRDLPGRAACSFPINEVLFPDQVAHIANDCRMKGSSPARRGSIGRRKR